MEWWRAPPPKTRSVYQIADCMLPMNDARVRMGAAAVEGGDGGNAIFHILRPCIGTAQRSQRLIC